MDRVSAIADATHMDRQGNSEDSSTRFVYMTIDLQSGGSCEIYHFDGRRREQDSRRGMAISRSSDSGRRNIKFSARLQPVTESTSIAELSLRYRSLVVVVVAFFAGRLLLQLLLLAVAKSAMA